MTYGTSLSFPRNGVYKSNDVVFGFYWYAGGVTGSPTRQVCGGLDGVAPETPEVSLLGMQVRGRPRGGIHDRRDIVLTASR